MQMTESNFPDEEVFPTELRLDESSPTKSSRLISDKGNANRD